MTKDNAFYICDALTVLERLAADSVDLAYLDPPWNSGSKLDKCIVDSEIKSHKEFVSYLSKVAQQLHRILKKNGSLFFHWSSVPEADMRLVLSQAFGSNPRYEITWPVKVFSNMPQHIPLNDNTYIMVYSKSEEFKYETISQPLSPRDALKRYPFTDSRGRYRVDTLFSGQDRLRMQFSWRGHKNPEGRSWRYSVDKLEELVRNKMITFPASGPPRLKRYLDDFPGTKIGTTWDDIPSHIPQIERTAFRVQKPLALMERILRLSTNEGDQVLDPFCGSGTTLVAAHKLGRRWLGADASEEASRISIARLSDVCQLKAEKDFLVLDQKAILEIKAQNSNYREFVASVEDINEMQDKFAELSNAVISLKRSMNIDDEDDDDAIESNIHKIEQWISQALANQSKTINAYIETVCSWLVGWDKLDSVSQSFLPQAELLYDNISKSSEADKTDYSPFIIQYCRALENELLQKLFSGYTQEIYARDDFNSRWLDEASKDNKTKLFVSKLRARKIDYTLGQMTFIMNLIKEGGKTLHSFSLLQDFREFVSKYFGERIVDAAYLDQIEKINSDYRCKAAHPYILDSQMADQCREQVRSCLNEFVLNYKGDIASN